MNARQKRIVAILAVADSLIILALVVLLTHRSGIRLSPPPTDHPVHQHPQGAPEALTAIQRTCEWRATQLLAHAGLGGTVTLIPDGPLTLRINHPLPPDQTMEADREVGEAAQAVWTAFDVALALQEQEAGCGIFTTVDIAILAYDDDPDIQIHASVSTTDLVAWGAGAMREEEFIDRVTYSTHGLVSE